ncbi:MAG: hypothetical protein Q8R36_00300 [bacterium]|nr:hypothetical protein [bacterium]
MRNAYVVAIACVILVAAIIADFYFFSNKANDTHLANDLFKKTEVETQGVAEKWIMEKSPTYIFDGAKLIFIESKKGSCETCSMFSFSFESSHGGYGNREGLILTQVIVSHAIEVETKDGAVAGAITDGKYNELTGALAE